MTEQEVISLMSSSKTEDEWNTNCNKVKEAYNGYPQFWYTTIIQSGLAGRTVARFTRGNKSTEIKITRIC